jgi:hypothetical protein
VVEEAALPTMLAWAWLAFTIEADTAFEARMAELPDRARFRISYAMWAHCLRFVDENGLTFAELRARSGQAPATTRSMVGGLERWGWLTVGTDEKRREGYGSGRGLRNDTVVRANGAGIAAGRLWPAVLTEVHVRWHARFGAERVNELERALGAVRLDTDNALPWAPPVIGPQDGFKTGWDRNGGSSMGNDPPLTAQLAQLLVAGTLDYESEDRVSLPIGADVLRVISVDGVPARDLPHLSGVSKEAITMALALLDRPALVTMNAGKSVGLTADGRVERDRHPSRIAEVEAGWRDARGDAAVSAMRDALCGVLNHREALSACFSTPAGCWRGEKPYVEQTRRLLDDPTGALPWHPMVLHRGGWPDGS